MKFLNKNNFHKIDSEYFISKVETSKIKKNIYFLKQIFKSFISNIKDILITTPLIYLLDQKYIYTKQSRDKKIKTLKSYEISKILNQINNMNSNYLNFKISKISNNVYLINKVNE